MEYFSKDDVLNLLSRNSITKKITLADGVSIYDSVKNLPAADVVPKSEVERLETEIKVLTENSISAKYPCCVSCSKGLILTKSLEEYDKLLADIASEVAREIFEEIDNKLHDMAVEYHNAGHPEYFAVCEVVHHKVIRQVEKKYTESEGNDTLNNTKNLKKKG